MLQRLLVWTTVAWIWFTLSGDVWSADPLPQDIPPPDYTLLWLIGLAILCYPMVSRWWHRQKVGERGWRWLRAKLQRPARSAPATEPAVDPEATIVSLGSLRARMVLPAMPASAPVVAGAAYLQDMSGISGRAIIPLGPAGVTFGRLPDPQLPLEQQVIISERSVSRRHARLTWQQGRYWLEDLGSVNGCQVNGQKVTQSRPVQAGDRLRIDVYEFELHLNPVDAEEVLDLI